MYRDRFELKTRINRIYSLEGCLEYSKYSKSPSTIPIFNSLVGFQIIFLPPKNWSNLMGQPCTLHSSQFLQNHHGHSFSISRKHPSTFHESTYFRTPLHALRAKCVFLGEGVVGVEVEVVWGYRPSGLGFRHPCFYRYRKHKLARVIPKYWLHVVLFLKQIWKKQRVFSKIFYKFQKLFLYSQFIILNHFVAYFPFVNTSHLTNSRQQFSSSRWL